MIIAFEKRDSCVKKLRIPIVLEINSKNKINHKNTQNPLCQIELR